MKLQIASLELYYKKDIVKGVFLESFRTTKMLKDP